jgi:hypothetical protein
VRRSRWDCGTHLVLVDAALAASGIGEYREHPLSQAQRTVVARMLDRILVGALLLLVLVLIGVQASRAG